MERVAGIEPASKDWKSLILPLYDTRTTSYHYTALGRDFRILASQF